MLEFILCIVLGYAAGLLTNGIRIYHYAKEDEAIQEDRTYNQSTEEKLPDEVRSYFEQNDGQWKI